MRKKQYIRCKETRGYRIYDERVFYPKSNTQSVINNMLNAKPNRLVRVEKENGSIVVKRVKDGD